MTCNDLHICEGTFDMEAYVGILKRHMPPSRRQHFPGTLSLFQQDNVRPHSAQVITAWLRRHRCVRLTGLPAVSYWKCTARHEQENQTTVTTDCRAAQVLYTPRMDNPTIQQLISSVLKRLQSVSKRKGDVTQWKTCLCANFFLGMLQAYISKFVYI